jgi:hypothetical protein
MNIETLNKALNDKSNAHLIDLNTNKLKEMNLLILRELHLPIETTIDIFNKLSDYKYVDNIKNLKYGSFLRWIPIEEMLLKKSIAIFCEFIINEKGTFCVCKSFRQQYFQLDVEKNLLFQKLTDQEKVLLSALDYLSGE